MSFTGCKWLLLAAFIGLSGCGSDLVPVYPVKGKVTGASGSLKGVRIIFTPSDPSGVSSTGAVEEDGSYSLVALDGRNGAVAGKHKVSFVLGSDAMQEAMKSMSKSPPKQSFGPGSKGTPGGGGAPNPSMNINLPIPKAYSSPATSPKEVEVKAESNSIDIAVNT
jgi:hypothetical protein